MINQDSNKFLKILTSIPVILISIYLSRFLGVLLILARFFIHRNKNKISLLVILVTTGIILLIPEIIYNVLSALNINANNVLYLNDIVSSKLYSVNIIEYGKRLITASIIIAIIIYLFKLLVNHAINKLSNGWNDYIVKEEKESKKNKLNDSFIKEKQSKSKSTHSVVCPNCGTVNMITGDIGICKHCRKKVVYKG